MEKWNQAGGDFVVDLLVQIKQLKTENESLNDRLTNAAIKIIQLQNTLLKDEALKGG